VRLSSAGLELIKSFEGLRLEAYPDPGTGGDPWTIGYGHTGPDVHKGLVITEVKADELLRGDVEIFEQCVSSFVKPSINQNEYDALVSFTYNVGTTAFVNSTLLQLLNEGEPRSTVAEQFGRWVKGGNGETLAGLVTRREKEAKLFLTPVKKKHPLLGMSILAKQDTWLKKRVADSRSLKADEKLFVPQGSAWEWNTITMTAGSNHDMVVLKADPNKKWYMFKDHWKVINDVVEGSVTAASSNEIKLSVPYYSQRDNYRDADRTCFSSSCAMLLSGLDPDAINNDDAYIKTVFEIGDTTEAWVQVAALEKYGVDAAFKQTGTWNDVESLLANGIPVPLGILHHGSVDQPSGGGHWICAVGLSADKKDVIVHDPFGDLDLVAGSYLSSNGKFLRYSKKNLGPRWAVEGSGSGWYIQASR
jgi:lysozyme